MGLMTALLRVLGVAAGLLEISRRAKRVRSLAAGGGEPGVAEPPHDDRLARGAGTAAREALDRERERLALERARFEAERRRADEALRLERLRQAAARQAAGVQLVAWVAVASWMASALGLLGPERGPAPGAAVLLGTGWAALLASIACALSAQAGIVREYAARLEDGSAHVAFTSIAGSAARWLLVSGLGLTGGGILLRLW